MAARKEANAMSEEKAKLRAVEGEAKAQAADDARVTAEERVKATEEARVFGELGIDEAVVEPKSDEKASLVCAPPTPVDAEASVDILSEREAIAKVEEEVTTSRWCKAFGYISCHDLVKTGDMDSSMMLLAASGLLDEIHNPSAYEAIVSVSEALCSNASNTTSLEKRHFSQLVIERACTFLFSSFSPPFHDVPEQFGGRSGSYDSKV